MPRRPRPVRQAKPSLVSDEVWSWLADESDESFEAFLVTISEAELRETAEQIMPDLLAYFIPLHPGTRPWVWWKFAAPQVDLFPDLFPKAPERPLYAEPRKRLGGKGTTPWDAGLAVVPWFEYGLPVLWEKDDTLWRLLDKEPPADFVAFDPTDPPRFESQSSYLRRHNLLFAGEERRLQPRDFRPEKVE